MIKFKSLLLGAVAAAACASAANAVVYINLAQNTGWQYGQLAKPSTVVIMQDASGNTVAGIKFTVTNAGGANFSFTDGFIQGDKYKVSFTGGSSFTTLFGPNPYQPDTFVNNFGPYASYFAPTWSGTGWGHGQLGFAPGTYIATVKSITSVGFPSGFGFRLDTVPEPASWSLMLLGIGGLGGMLRSRRNAVAARAERFGNALRRRPLRSAAYFVLVSPIETLPCARGTLPSRR